MTRDEALAEMRRAAAAAPTHAEREEARRIAIEREDGGYVRPPIVRAVPRRR